VEIHFDGRGGTGTVEWKLASRHGQDVTSSIYQYSDESEVNNFKRKIGKFTMIRQKIKDYPCLDSARKATGLNG
jgi:hypothetical protein